MIYIFFLFGILAIIWEFMQITNIKKMHRIVTTIKKAGKDKTTKDLPKTYTTLGFFMIGYFFWAVIGLFTGQWLIFLILLAVSMIPKKHIAIRWIDSVISLGLILFAMINAIHLHISMTDLIDLIM